MSPPATVRGRVDSNGRLVAADPALEALQREAGAKVGDPLALPPLDALARLARRLGITISRPLRVADGEFDLDLFVRASPAKGDVELAIASWDAGPARAPRSSKDLLRVDDRVRAVADWTWESDAALVLTAVSPQARWRLGLPPERLVGQPLAALFRLAEDAEGRAPLLVGLAEQRRVDGQIVSLRTGPNLTFRLSAQPLFDPDGHFVGFRGAAVRVPASTGPSSALPDMLDESRLGTVLREPLAKIVAQAEAIGSGEQGPLRRDYADYAHDIAAAARHLLSLVDDLVDLQAVERADFAPAREPVDLADIGRRAAALFGVRAADNGVTIEKPVAGDAAPALGEYRRVLQIAVNLVGNAVRHAPRGTTVRLAAATDASGARLIVADDGPGIPADDQERVFEKFVRLNPSAGEGTGLGLYISRRLARAMGGELLLESRPGEGARFTLRLPPR